MENERMRISLIDSEKCNGGEVHYETKGICKAVALQAIASILHDEFNMIPVPVPKNESGGIIVCARNEEELKKFVSLMKDEEGDNGECSNTEAKGEDNNE